MRLNDEFFGNTMTKKSNVRAEIREGVHCGGSVPSVALEHVNILGVISRQKTLFVEQSNESMTQRRLESSPHNGQEILLGDGVE
jgi:hypothetical protein